MGTPSSLREQTALNTAWREEESLCVNSELDTIAPGFSISVSNTCARLLSSSFGFSILPLPLVDFSKIIYDLVLLRL